MTEAQVEPRALPASAQKLPAGVSVKGAEVKRDGVVTEVLVKKQVSLTEEARLVNPHLKHWWFLFRVGHDEPPYWLQVDLILASGYRVIWNAGKTEAEGVAYEEKAAPSGLHTAAIEQAVEAIATERTMYYNPTPPNPEVARYSCQDFVVLLAGRLGITL
ncbi:hypothetical protein [Cellulosimicrobium marinum]|uniref:hypothetical protein n=1 Tax=Cellulosimicrobium marinum TaxID=1638992 RepID=UPI001E3FB241|nr:hypothetical protein [Cellulosimicrobium marinum]MCB7135862.1 hypothetical protein [Cellulosimicrobium marinum]